MVAYICEYAKKTTELYTLNSWTVRYVNYQTKHIVM